MFDLFCRRINAKVCLLRCLFVCLLDQITEIRLFFSDVFVGVDCSESPIFSVGFSRLVRFDRTPAILVCKGKRNLGRVSKLPRGTLVRVC